MKIVKFRGETLTPVFDRYQDNDRLALVLLDEVGISYARASVNLPDEPLGEDEIFIKDYSENEGIFNALVDAGLIVDSGRVVESGFVTIKVGILVVDPKDYGLKSNDQ